MVAAKRRKSAKALELPHRGRIQAQGGGVEKSVSWSRQTPPSEREMMVMVEQLEAKPTPGERRERESYFEQLREYIHRATIPGGIGVRTKTFPFRPIRGIRVDLEVLTGTACLPDLKKKN